MTAGTGGLICYCCAGVGADDRLFADFRKHLPFPVQTICWPDAIPGETVSEFAQRIKGQIDTSRPFILLGVSFGSVVALELARLTSPVMTIIVSGITKAREIPPLLKIGHSLKTFAMIRLLVNLPRSMLKYGGRFVFGARRSEDSCLLDMLQESDPAFIQWALGAMARWQGSGVESRNILRVHGTGDRLIPCPREGDLLIPGEGHLVICSHAEPIAELVTARLREAGQYS